MRNHHQPTDRLLVRGQSLEQWDDAELSNDPLPSRAAAQPVGALLKAPVGLTPADNLPSPAAQKAYRTRLIDGRRSYAGRHLIERRMIRVTSNDTTQHGPNYAAGETC